jgi:transposase
VPYTEGFKEQMVKRMLGPPAVTATSLSQQVGVPQPTLSKWLKQAATVAAMSNKTEKPKSRVAGPKKWTAEEKLRVVVEAEGVTGSALGELLRREGLHEDQLRSWREAAAGALDSAEASPSGTRTAGEKRRMAAMNKRVKQLEKELHRKEKALAETAALLVLKKKMEAFWEAEGDGTDNENER